VAHAGHFQLLELLKGHNLLTLENSTHSLNNNLLIVQKMIKMMDATEEKWIIHSNTLKKIHLNKNLIIHMKDTILIADMIKLKQSVKFMDLLMFHKTLLT
jgi:uncharacterized protein YjcR